MMVKDLKDIKKKVEKRAADAKSDLEQANKILNLKLRLKKTQKIRKVEEKEQFPEIKKQTKFGVITRGFRGAFQSITGLPTHNNLFSYSNFFNDSKRSMREVLSRKLIEMHGLKIKISYLGLFLDTKPRGPDAPEPEPQPKNFRAKVYEIVNIEDIKESVNNALNDLIVDIEEFVSGGSGWRFISNIQLDINVYNMCQFGEVHISIYHQ